jgi:hypothetical protein
MVHTFQFQMASPAAPPGFVGKSSRWQAGLGQIAVIALVLQL